jgi:hypothetical protein
MNISNTNNNKNLTSNSLGFYLYELLGVDYSGIYITSIELRGIAEKLGLDIKLTDNHKMFGEILTLTQKEGRTAETLGLIKELVNSRISIYKELSERFGGAADRIEEWQIKAQRASRKIDNAIKEVKNESVS